MGMRGRILIGTAEVQPSVLLLSSTTTTTTTAFHHRHARLSIPITHPHPTILKPLLLPNLHSRLNALQALLARPPARLPMRRRDSNQHALVPDIHSSQPMRDSDPHELVFAVHGFGDGE